MEAPTSTTHPYSPPCALAPTPDSCFGGSNGWRVSLPPLQAAERLLRRAELAQEFLAQAPRRRSDTRPFRGRRGIAYAGCMTVVRTAAIESVYSSRPSHRYGLWLRSPTFEFYERLVQFSQEAGHGLAHSGARCSRCSNEAPGLLVAPATRCSGSGAYCAPCSEPLDSRLRGNDGRGPGCEVPASAGTTRGARLATRAARSPARTRSAGPPGGGASPASSGVRGGVPPATPAPGACSAGRPSPCPGC